LRVAPGALSRDGVGRLLGGGGAVRASARFLAFRHWGSFDEGPIEVRPRADAVARLPLSGPASIPERVIHLAGDAHSLQILQPCRKK
jgi:hypothetical protein